MRPAAFLLVLLFLGCDSAEYQKRMDQNRARMKLFDEEVKILGKPIEQPTLKIKTDEVPAWPFEVFLRVPRGISVTVAGEKEFGVLRHQGFPLFRYPGDSDSTSMMIGAALLGEAKKDRSKEEEKGGPRLDEPTFRNHVVFALHDYYRAAYLGNMQYPKPFTPARKVIDVPSVGGEKRVALKFDLFTFEGWPSTKEKEAVAFYLYYHQAEDRQIAIVFQIPAARKEDATELRKMELSLRTLALGEAAGPRRREYERLFRK